MDTIYIITNPLFPDYVKLGYTKCIYSRLKKLSTSVPMGYKLIFSKKSKYAKRIESNIHSELANDLMINLQNTASKEWYKVGENEFFRDIESFIHHVKYEIKRCEKSYG